MLRDTMFQSHVTGIKGNRTCRSTCHLDGMSWENNKKKCSNCTIFNRQRALFVTKNLLSIRVAHINVLTFTIKHNSRIQF